MRVTGFQEVRPQRSPASQAVGPVSLWPLLILTCGQVRETRPHAVSGSSGRPTRLLRRVQGCARLSTGQSPRSLERQAHRLPARAAPGRARQPMPGLLPSAPPPNRSTSDGGGAWRSRRQGPQQKKPRGTQYQALPSALSLDISTGLSRSSLPRGMKLGAPGSPRRYTLLATSSCHPGLGLICSQTSSAPAQAS